jgi:hypothetical protein
VGLREPLSAVHHDLAFENLMNDRNLDTSSRWSESRATTLISHFRRRFLPSFILVMREEKTSKRRFGKKMLKI